MQARLTRSLTSISTASAQRRRGRSEWCAARYSAAGHCHCPLDSCKQSATRAPESASLQAEAIPSVADLLRIYRITHRLCKFDARYWGEVATQQNTGHCEREELSEGADGEREHETNADRETIDILVDRCVEMNGISDDASSVRNRPHSQSDVPRRSPCVHRHPTLPLSSSCVCHNAILAAKKGPASSAGQWAMRRSVCLPAEAIGTENPVLLSTLTDSLARSSIKHLRVNSRCLM